MVLNLLVHQSLTILEDGGFQGFSYTKSSYLLVAHNVMWLEFLYLATTDSRGNCIMGNLEVRGEPGHFTIAGAKVTYHEDTETVCLEFDCELSISEVVISIAYTGYLNDQMRGFYRFKHTTEGEERYGAGTQF